MDPMNATLLLVDDEAPNRDALSRRLQRSGYTVLTADGGAVALEMIGAHRIDAVLLDVMMPGMSGLDTLRRLRELRSAADLPVIMVTANDGSDAVVEALGLGANDYVTKPVDFAVAVARINTQLTSRRADPLTGLPNRVVFMNRLERLVARKTGVTGFAVLFVDVDRFKSINDSLGHLTGDELLIGIARRLERSLRSTDTVSRFDGEHTLARLGGDEFIIVLEGVQGSDAVKAIAERLGAVTAQPFTVHGREVYTSISIGIVLNAPHYKSAEEMVRDADIAMYQAKARGKARCELFDLTMQAAVERRLNLESDLRHALERNELRLYYQPIVTMSDGRMRGFEALLRWQHPERGLVLPGEFIGSAEETGLIVPIGRWVLGEACRQLRAWDAQFPASADLTVNVNLSAKQCVQPDLVKDVANALADTGLSPQRLKLEITEGVLLDSSESIVATLNELRQLGVQLGLDDFGMGYSALSYLQRFPFQALKIDRSFVMGMHEGRNAEIIRAIVALAEGLGLEVTAEGVETAEQMNGLKQLACGFGQGFYFHKPLNTAAVAALLEAQVTAGASC